MKLKHFSALVAFGVAMVSQQAFAADGTISFTGAITASTCTINGGAAGASSFSVTLPTVSSTTLNTVGSTAGRTPFQIALTNCPAGSKVHTFFEAGTYTDASTGRLNIATGTGKATGVQIQLLNDDSTIINAGYADASQNSKAVTLGAAVTAVNLTYYAQYYATAPTAAGTVDSSVLYTIAYN